MNSLFQHILPTAVCKAQPVFCRGSTINCREKRYLPFCSPAQLTQKMDQSFEKMMRVLIIAVTVLVSAFAMSPSIADPDLWGHVQFGREFLESGQLETTTSYSFTAEGYRWINHENLSEIVMAWLVDHVGSIGLLLGKFLLSLFVIGTILLFNFRAKVGIVPTCALTILVAWNLGYHWSFRPQLATFALFAMMVIILQVGFKNWRGSWKLSWLRSSLLTRDDEPASIQQSPMQSRLLWLAVLVVLVWTNSHGGFVAGVCIFVAYLGCRSIEALSNPENHKPLVGRFAMMTVAVLLVTLINPYSYRLPAWLIESLGTPRPEISDWSSNMLTSVIGMKFWGLIFIVVFSLVASRKSLDFTQIVLLGLTLWQAISHFRHVPFFAILAGFWVGPHLHSALQRFGSEKDRATTSNAIAQNMLAVAMILMMGLIGFRLSERLSELKVDRQQFPVEAIQYMSDHRLGGKLVVSYDWAQYAIAALCVKENLSPDQPVSRVAFDGRFRTCYPQEIVDMHFDLLFGDKTQRARSPNSPPIDPSRVLSHGDPDLVLIKRIGEASQTVMDSQAESWALLYQDRIAQLWGRRDRYDRAGNPDYVAAEHRIIGNQTPTGYATWPAFPIVRLVENRPDRLADFSAAKE